MPRIELDTAHVGGAQVAPLAKDETWRFGHRRIDHGVVESVVVAGQRDPQCSAVDGDANLDTEQTLAA